VLKKIGNAGERRKRDRLTPLHDNSEAEKCPDTRAAENPNSIIKVAV